MIKAYFRKIFAVMITALMLFGCAGNTQKQSKTIAEKLAEADGVIRVDAIAGNTSEWMPEKYILTFEQQLDWKNPDAGTFEQRVEIGLHPGANITVLETYGYALQDSSLPTDDQPEVCSILDASYVKVEHRFMGDSFPEGTTLSNTIGWDYATIENEAGDYHRIYESLSKVLGGRWVCCGRSRGGRACLDYAMLYPEDRFAGYVPYAAPVCTTDRDQRVAELLDHHVGDSAFGEEKGAELRNTVLDFQTEVMRNKSELATVVFEAIQTAGLSFNGVLSESSLLDLTVYEFQGGYWASDGDAGELQTVLSMKEDTAEEREAKLKAEADVLMEYGDPSSYSTEFYTAPFYLCALLNEGMYDYDFSVLRNRLREEGLEDRLEISEQDQKEFLRNVMLTEEQKKAFHFTAGNYEALNGWLKTANANIIHIGGDLDPWSAVYPEPGNNPNFHMYIKKGKSHHTQISDFDESTRNEIIRTMKSWIQ